MRPDDRWLVFRPRNTWEWETFHSVFAKIYEWNPARLVTLPTSRSTADEFQISDSYHCPKEMPDWMIKSQSKRCPSPESQAQKNRLISWQANQMIHLSKQDDEARRSRKWVISTRNTKTELFKSGAMEFR